MIERPCDGYEIAIEMRRHGAADEEASRRLDAHLEGCDRCRAYERLASGSDEALRGRTGDVAARVDWDGLRRRVTAGSQNAQRAALLGSALWAVLLGGLWLDRAAVAKVPFLEPLPQVLPVLVALTLFGIVLNAGRVLQALDRQRELEEAGSTTLFLATYRRELGRALRLGRWACGLTLLLMPLAAWRWSRFHGPFDTHARVALLGQLGLLGLALLLFFVRRPRLQREDAELARFEAGAGGPA